MRGPAGGHRLALVLGVLTMHARVMAPDEAAPHSSAAMVPAHSAAAEQLPSLPPPSIATDPAPGRPSVEGAPALPVPDRVTAQIARLGSGLVSRPLTQQRSGFVGLLRAWP